MLDRLYTLVHYGYDGSSKWVFYGPDIGGDNEWGAFCDSLMPEAARQAIANETRDNGNNGFVGSSDIMIPLLKLIEGRGYVRLKPTSTGYGEVVIYKENERGRLPLGEVEDAVIAHNADVERCIGERREKRQAEQEADK